MLLWIQCTLSIPASLGPNKSAGFDSAGLGCKLAYEAGAHAKFTHTVTLGLTTCNVIGKSS